MSRAGLGRGLASLIPDSALDGDPWAGLTGAQMAPSTGTVGLG